MARSSKTRFEILMMENTILDSSCSPLPSFTVKSKRKEKATGDRRTRIGREETEAAERRRETQGDRRDTGAVAESQNGWEAPHPRLVATSPTLHRIAHESRSRTARPRHQPPMAVSQPLNTFLSLHATRQLACCSVAKQTKHDLGETATLIFFSNSRNFQPE